MTKALPPQSDDTTAQAKDKTPLNTAPHPQSKKRIILDPDGKPCRSCNNYRDFFGATKGITSSVPRNAPPECPPDVEQLGNASWTVLHSIAATYPPQATPIQQEEMKQFLTIFSKIYPCWSCAEDFRGWMAKPENDVSKVVEGRKTLGQWLCEAHNDVNRKIGKKTFDCSKWEERWRTGGKGC